MAEVASAFVSLLPSARGFGAKLDKEIGGDLDKSGKGAGKRFGAALKVGAVAGGAALGTFLNSVVGESSSAQQSLGATESIFKQFANTVITSSKSAATEYGLSANQYRESANLIGSLFKNQGVSMDQLAGSTDKMIGRAADLAAMFGGTTTEAVEALGSAFKGEFNPLERYGITLTATAINAELAARGQDKLTGSALAAAKQAATTDLIMRQSADATGTFAKESNTLAGQQQRLGAEWSNLKVVIGNAFIPIATRAITVVRGMLTSLAPLGSTLRSIGGFFMENRASIGAFVGVIGTVVLATKLWAAAQTLLNIALTANPIGLVVVAVAALVAGIVYAYQNFTSFRNVLGSVGNVISATLQPILTALADVYRQHIAPAVQQVIAKFRQWMPAIMQVVGLVVGLQARVLGFVGTILGSALPALGRMAGFLIGAYASAIATAIGVVARIISAVVSFGAALISAAQKAGQFAAAVRQKVGEAIAVVARIPGQVVSALGDLGSTLYNAGANLIDGLIDGISSKIGEVKSKISELAGAVRGFFPGSPIKEGPLKSWNNGGAGKRLIDQGLIAGLKKRRDALTREIEQIAKRFDLLKQANADLQRDTAANFRTDPFGENSTVAGVIRSLNANTAGAKAHNAAAERARKLGLSGQVYRELLKSGNTAILSDVNTRAEVKALEAAWWRRNKATANFTIGAFPDRRGVADTFAEMDALMKELRAEIKRIGDRVEKGARDGTDKTRKNDQGKRKATASKARA